MNKSQRIRTNIDFSGDKNLKVKLEQGVDTLEILSLKIDQRDLYQFFNCDYGVLIGRVNANGGVGIPNAKISIFIPIDEEDEAREEIRAIYPYKTPRDQDADGKRYNLLPRVATEREDGSVKPIQPFGSFPTKEEFVANETYLEVYEKYYKYSTVTNNSGDYMLFGVPVGVQTVHMSVDITDIGRFSMTPASLVTNLGYSPNLFTDNGTRIKPSNDLNDLPNIETQEISVDVIPFCGDSENFDIGITRQDFRIRAELVSTFTIFGTSLTDGENSMWSEDVDGSRKVRELYRIRDTPSSTFNLSVSSKRIAPITERVFSLSQDISDDDADALNFDPDNDVFLLESNQYSRFIRDGDFVFIINCNRNKVITNEFGELERIPDDSADGVFSEFRGYVTLEYLEEDARMDFSTELGSNTDVRPFRHRIKIPQQAERNEMFDSDDSNPNTINWKKQHSKFSLNTIYSVAKFHGYIFNNEDNDNNFDYDNGFTESDIINDPFQRGSTWGTGVIVTGDNPVTPDNSSLEFPSNTSVVSAFDNNQTTAFAANWLNFCVYFIQTGYKTGFGGDDDFDDFRSNSNFTYEFRISDHFYRDNNQTIGGNVRNTKHFERSDLHYTSFVEVPVEDLITIRDKISTKGFYKNADFLNLNGDYANAITRTVPFNGGKLKGDASNPLDSETYFYKGLGSADCIDYLFELGIV
jgi:hypothetical protein